MFAAEKKVYVPPYVVAIEKLERLKEEKLWQAGKTKEYYTRLTDAVRQYVADELQIPAMEQTSFETVQALERNTLVDARDAEKIAGLLQEADFVKFAKSTPLPEENMKNLDVAYDFLQHTNERLKSSREEEKDGEAENTSETAASEL